MQLRVIALAGCAVVAACGDDDNPGLQDGGPDGAPDAPPDVEDPGVVPRVEPAACRYEVPASIGLAEGEGYACGDLVVYENRDTKTRAIRLHFIRFESTAASANATIYLDGGPGGDGQNMVRYAGVLGAPFLDGLRTDGDFVVLGQRGTARSLPFLDCEAPDCADFAMYDLSAYNTAANADDVEDLRAALGYEQLNLYGISYGSRLGLEVLRRHGEHVRAAVIEGLVPSSVAWPAAVPASFYSGLTALNASCAAASGCGAAYGELVSKFSSGLASLNATPLSIPGVSFDLDGYTYASLLFRALYSKSTFPWLPMMINDIAERRTDRIASFVNGLLDNLGNSNISSGLYNVVVCGEIFNPPDENAFVQLNAGVPDDIVQMLGGSWYYLMERCKTFPVGDLQAQLAQPVSSSVRTLVSSGRLDPITPPGFGDIAAATLSNSVVVIHENSGHGATLQSTCGMQNLAAFILDPDATHDTSCAASVATTYVLPSMVTTPAIPWARVRAELAFAPPLL